MIVRSHGWKSQPSPRRGFTVVEASRENTASPVVVAIHDSPPAFWLFREAADAAMSRCRNLVVLDYGDSPLQAALSDPARSIGPRERTALRTLLANPHVSIVRIEPEESALERTIAYCEAVSACLVVLGADHIASSDLDRSLAARLFDGDFDVLVVTEPADRPGDVSRPAGTG